MEQKSRSAHPRARQKREPASPNKMLQATANFGTQKKEGKTLPYFLPASKLIDDKRASEDDC